MLPQAFEGRRSCCFTGHRPNGLPAHGNEQADAMILLKYRLAHAAEEAIALGVNAFWCGGAEGFDMLAAEAVLLWQAQYPDTALHLALPSRTQAELMHAGARARYEEIVSRAASVWYASETDNGFASMRARNRRLVEQADCCIAYLRRSSGGTLYTVNYALNCGLPVFNLANGAQN